MKNTVLRRIAAVFLSVLTLTGVGVLSLTADYSTVSASVSADSLPYLFSVNADSTLTITKYTGRESITYIPQNINGRLVTGIGAYAFDGCTGLKKIHISKNIRNISGNAFIGCSDLKTFLVDSLNKDYTAVNGVLFSKNKSVLKAYPVARLGAYSIPAGVKLIDSYAFSECNKLTSVELPASVRTIGVNAFAYCQGLKKASLNSGLTDIKAGAFNGCKNLTKINLPDSITVIDRNAFSGCRSLTSMVIPPKVKILNFSLFEGCSSLNYVIIPNGVTKVYSNVFDHCSSLTSVRLPKSVTNIHGLAFCCCENLTSLTILSNTAQIDKIAFTNCPMMTVYGKKGSTAEKAAKLNGVAFSDKKAPLQGISTASAAGKTITVTSKGIDGTAPYTYAVYYRRDDEKVWNTAQKYSANKTIRLKVQKAGTYHIFIRIKDADGNISEKKHSLSVK